MGNIQINEKRGIPRFKFRKNKGGGGSASSSGGEDPTPEALAESLDELSTTDQIAELTEWQAWCKEHPHAKGMAARLRRIRLDEFLAKRLQEAHQKLGQHHAPVRPWLQRRHQHGHAAAAQHTAQQAYNAQQASIAAEAARIAEQQRLAAIEAAEQAEAVRLLEESARLTAQAAVAQRAVEAATQQVTQLEAQLVTAQAATQAAKQEAIQVTQQCTAQKAEVERMLETVNARVTQTVAQYTVILDEAKAHAAICGAERKEMYAKPAPHPCTPALTAADKFLRESKHIRTAARINAEHAKLQQATVLDLQKAIDELSELAQQQVTHRTTAQEQTRAAVHRAAQTAANLTAQQIIAQQDAATANTQLMTMRHRITSVQQTEAEQRANATAQQTATKLIPEVAVEQTLSQQLVDVRTRLSATQAKIQQTHQAIAEIMAMEAEAEHKKIHCLQKSEFLLTTTYTGTLQYLMQEYLLRKELVELEQQGNPLAEQLTAGMTQIVAAKATLKTAEADYQQLPPGTPRFTANQVLHPQIAVWENAIKTYQGAVAVHYQALLQRKAEKRAALAQQEVTQLTAQQAEATKNLQHLIDTLAAQTEIDPATTRLTELTTRLTTLQAQLQEAMQEVTRLAAQDAGAKHQAEYWVNRVLQGHSNSTILARKNDQHRAHYAKSIDRVSDDKLDVIWGRQYSNTLTDAIDAHSIQLRNPYDYDELRLHQSTLPKTKTSPSDFNAASTSGLTLISLELLFKYGRDKLLGDDDTKTLRLDDQSLNFATLVFALDLLYLLIYHAPTMDYLRSLTDAISLQSLAYLQSFICKHPAIYQKSSARLFNLLHPTQYAPAQTITSTSQHNAAINHAGLSGWQLAESARLSLQSSAKFAVKRNPGFFKMTPEPREQDNFFVGTDVQTNAQFTAWAQSIDAEAAKLNPIDLPAEIRADFHSMSKALDQTETVQRTMAI